MTLIRGAEVDGRTVDVRIRGEWVAEIGALRPERDEPVHDAAGGALLPGLHDHHIHLLSLAAAARSVWCGPPDVLDEAGLVRVLAAAPGWWVRGIGYHESVAGVPDRTVLDRLAPGRPVRVQHRGGALWVLNTPALTELDLTGVAPDGRLWRADDLLRDRLGPADPPDLAAVGRQLAAWGVTGVTDATPELPADTVDLLTGAGLPQRLRLLGAAAATAVADLGPMKILPADHEPPDWAGLRERIGRAHAAGRPVAVHAVTRESLVVTLAVLADVGVLPGDRIEHAAVIGADVLPLLADLGVTVVTQPGLVTERAAEYRQAFPVARHGDLYRYASLLRAGIPVAPSSDAPFATADPWRIMRAAAERLLAPAERVSPRQVLDGFLTPSDDPGGAPRQVRPGAPADLCLLRVPLATALSTPDAGHVAATFCRGGTAYP
ncbi:MAG TPA: amidohydrolase family protein [Mycobacteriales bacterium]|nr:amidohydrolase family protein [Mycobacteriales bacterium]